MVLDPSATRAKSAGGLLLWLGARKATVVLRSREMGPEANECAPGWCSQPGFLPPNFSQRVKSKCSPHSTRFAFGPVPELAGFSFSDFRRKSGSGLLALLPWQLES